MLYISYPRHILTLVIYGERTGFGTHVARRFLGYSYAVCSAFRGESRENIHVKANFARIRIRALLRPTGTLVYP